MCVYPFLELSYLFKLEPGKEIMRHLVAAKLIIILAAVDKIVENAPKVTTRYANIWTSAARMGWDLNLRKRELRPVLRGTRAAAGENV